MTKFNVAVLCFMMTAHIITTCMGQGITYENHLQILKGMIFCNSAPQGILDKMCTQLAVFEGWTQVYRAYCQYVNNVYLWSETEYKSKPITEQLLICEHPKGIIGLGRGIGYEDVMEYDVDGDGDFTPSQNRERFLQDIFKS